MNPALDRFFGLHSLRFGAEGVEFTFARPIPAWGWALAAGAALALAWWSYSHLTGPRTARVILAGIRATLLLLLLLLISGPQLIRPNERVEKDWVLVLLDRSASMSIADVPGPERQTRDRQLRDAVAAAWGPLSKLNQERTVVWLGFDAGAYELKLRQEAGAPVGVDPGEPLGRRTSLGAALDQALQRAAARPVSGVVIISDGRSIDEPGRTALRRLQAEHIPVLTVPLGSRDPVPDLAVVDAQAPQLAFVNDTVPVIVRVERLGSGPALGGTIRLIDKATGRILDERPLPTDDAAWEAGRARIALTTKPDLAGSPTWIVRVVPDRPDLVEENNQAEVRTELVDRPVRVAYFDGYPRWEYRYLKNLFVRERSISSASLLLASNRRYLLEGDISLPAVPRSPEEWAAFDVIVMGDLPAGLFSHEQLEQIKEHVAVRGAGLLWIGGPGATPRSWRGTPLADLLPFSMPSGDDDGVRAWEEPITVVRSPSADRLGVLELGETPEQGWPASLSDPATGWSQLRWAQRIDAAVVKPTAEVLAWARPVSAGPVPPAGPAPGADGSTPLVLTMRYGAGRVMYVATDEIWRWRYARGEALPERFWLPLIRLQGRESLARTSRSAVLDVSPRRAEIRRPIRVSVDLLDQALVDAAGQAPSITVRVTRKDSNSPGPALPEREAPRELRLAPERSGPGPARSFAAIWIPDEAGRYRLEPTDPVLTGLGIAAEAEVALDDDELRHPETDHPLLERLAADTGGQVLTPASMDRIPELLPKREIRIAGTPDVETLWDKPIDLAALVLLLTLEWVGRRLIKLS
jgi:hypothetical protein